MKQSRIWLAGLLAVQLVAALLIFNESRTSDNEAVDEPLLTTAPAEVDRIVVRGSDSEANLVKVDEAWVLPSLDNLPASPSRVSEILEELAAIDTRWPVTRTRASHQRFEVADEAPQRYVQLSAGDAPVAEFYLGTSPGFRKVHLRRVAEDPVYAVELSVHDLPDRDGDWLDKTLLAVQDPTRIEGPDYTLVQSGEDHWSMENGADQDAATVPPVDDERARQLVSALAGLRVQSAVEKPQENDPGKTKTLSLGVETAAGHLDFTFMTADGEYFVQRSDRDTLFSISQYDYERITEINRAELAADSGASEDGEEGAGGEEPLAG
jgi:hypothetical protein